MTEDLFQEPIQVTPLEEEDKKECVLCNRLWGFFGILAGLAILFIGTDILTGGLLSNIISGGTEDD